MKLHRIVFSMIGLLAIFSLSACKKEDKTPPTVSFISPADGATFAPGDTIQISGTVQDDVELAEGVIEVTLVSNGSLLYTAGGEVTTNPATVSGAYVVGVPSGSSLEIHLEATDAAGNAYDEHAHIHIQ